MDVGYPLPDDITVSPEDARRTATTTTVTTQPEPSTVGDDDTITAQVTADPGPRSRPVESSSPTASPHSAAAYSTERHRHACHLRLGPRRPLHRGQIPGDLDHDPSKGATNTRRTRSDPARRAPGDPSGLAPCDCRCAWRPRSRTCPGSPLPANPCALSSTAPRPAPASPTPRPGRLQQNGSGVASSAPRPRLRRRLRRQRHMPHRHARSDSDEGGRGRPEPDRPWSRDRRIPHRYWA